ncbi:hypothetical protein [Microbacterium sp.]|uniref:hypothetical protein n=1 Tax=Microbacterium sp. TaxID=51671 RepID=UPI003C71FD83
MSDAAPFSGPGYPVAGVRVIPRGRATYRSEPEADSTPVRHLAGYEPFSALCRVSGVNPRDLASDVARIGDFVRQRREAIRSGGLEEAAATFLGNVLVGLREDAAWTRYGDEFPSAGTEQRHYEVLLLLDLLMDSDDATYRTCLDMIEEWGRS